jgi:long-subunit fatty acid transport protein
MYLKTDEKHSGVFPLPVIGDVPFEIELESKDKWNYAVGAGYAFNDRVNLSLELGFGNRTHTLFNFNVRF